MIRRLQFGLMLFYQQIVSSFIFAILGMVGCNHCLYKTHICFGGAIKNINFALLIWRWLRSSTDRIRVS